MYYITSNNTILFRSKDRAKLQAKYESMVARGFHTKPLYFTDIKPVQPKQALNISILSY